MRKIKIKAKERKWNQVYCLLFSQPISESSMTFSILCDYMTVIYNYHI